jgi:TM2 domain-containing membrane protein YozV
MILTYYDANGNLETFTTARSSLTIGSSSECDLIVDGLESQACEIYLADDGFYAKDLRGELAINDRPGPGYIKDNETLTLGGWLSLRFGVDEIEEHTAPPPPPPPPPPTHEELKTSIQPGAKHHNSKTAVVLGLLLPGGGQAYNGQPFKGAFFLLTTVLVLPWVWSLFDARSTATRLAAAGGRTGRGGPLWFIFHGWFAINVALTALLVLTLAGVLK